jgi:hypothetical protein
MEDFQDFGLVGGWLGPITDDVQSNLGRGKRNSAQD